MKKTKIYIQYPWKFPDSPYYKYLLESHPSSLEYINNSAEGATSNRKRFLFSNILKRMIRRTIRELNLPLINSHLTKNVGQDIIHCAHCLSLNNSPWVADFEGAWQCWVSGNTNGAGKKRIAKLLTGKNCKKIMPWTEKTKEEFIRLFPEIKDKLEVVYPAVPEQKIKRKQNKKVTLIYVARYFWIKGGLMALETMRRLKKKYDLDTIFISEVPENLKSEYKEINILPTMPSKKLNEYYAQSDIFFYPSLVDTFGFSLLEAMSFGLPIVSVNTNDTKTRDEIVIDGKNGFLIEAKEKWDLYKIGEKEESLVQRLVSQTAKLIENKKLRARMSQECINMVRDGKFSIKERNKKMKRIYEEALDENSSN